MKSTYKHFTYIHIPQATGYGGLKKKAKRLLKRKAKAATPQASTSSKPPRVTSPKTPQNCFPTAEEEVTSTPGGDYDSDGASEPTNMEQSRNKRCTPGRTLVFLLYISRLNMSLWPLHGQVKRTASSLKRPLRFIHTPSYYNISHLHTRLYIHMF